MLAGKRWDKAEAKYGEHKYLESHSAAPYVYHCHLDH